MSVPHIPAEWDRTELYVVAACSVLLMVLVLSRMWRAWRWRRTPIA